MRPKLLLTRRWPSQVETELQAIYDVTTDAGDRKLGPEALAKAMLAHDVLCPTVSDRLDADILLTPQARVRLIASYGVGFDHIDLDAARAAGIVVTNTPDVLTDATADLAMLLMLMATRRAGEGERELRAGNWSGWRPTHLMGQSLAGKTLGVVGLGRIGRAVASRAHHGFGMRIAYHDQHRPPRDVEASLEARYVDSVEALAARCDVLTLHCQGGAQTHHLVNRALLARMKPTAVVVNTARGSVVDEAALAEALRTGVIAAAGLDVFETEPTVHAGLRALENVVLLPHLGSATLETRVAMGRRAAANIAAFLSGQEPSDRVA